MGKFNLEIFPHQLEYELTVTARGDATLNSGHDTHNVKINVKLDDGCDAEQWV